MHNQAHWRQIAWIKPQYNLLKFRVALCGHHIILVLFFLFKYHMSSSLNHNDFCNYFSTWLLTSAILKLALCLPFLSAHCHKVMRTAEHSSSVNEWQQYTSVWMITVPLLDHVIDQDLRERCHFGSKEKTPVLYFWTWRAFIEWVIAHSRSCCCQLLLFTTM